MLETIAIVAGLHNAEVMGKGSSSAVVILASPKTLDPSRSSGWW